MTNKEFLKVVKELDQHCFEILDDREKVYTTEDRLSNFKRVACMKGETPEEALWGMVAKQIIATQDAIQEHKKVSLDKWREWLGDIINYMRLLYALKVEEK